MCIFMEWPLVLKIRGGATLQYATDNLAELVLVFLVYRKVAFPIDFHVIRISGPR